MLRERSLQARLFAYKEAHGWNVSELARQSGISTFTLYAIFNGRTSERHLSDTTVNKLRNMGIKLREYRNGIQQKAVPVNTPVDAIRSALEVLKEAGIHLNQADVDRVLKRLDPSEATVSDFKYWFRDAAARQSHNGVVRFVVSVPHGKDHASFSWYEDYARQSRLMRRIQKKHRWNGLHRGMAAVPVSVPMQTAIN